jgi:hypothetical protein
MPPTNMEIKVAQNTLYAAYLEAKKLPPEETVKVMGRLLRAGMSKEEVAQCEKEATSD